MVYIYIYIRIIITETLIVTLNRPIRIFNEATSSDRRHDNNINIG